MCAVEHIPHAHTKRSEGTSQGEVPLSFSQAALSVSTLHTPGWLAHKFSGISPLSISRRSSRVTGVCHCIRLFSQVIQLLWQVLLPAEHSQLIFTF